MVAYIVYNFIISFSINIEDENDSPPVLKYPRHVLQISEYHELSDVVAHIKATDADDPLTPNGKVEFNVAGGSGTDLFKLIQRDAWTCEVYAKQSLHDYYGNYTLLVNARDLGTPQNNVEAQLNIAILDFNDHAPQFVAPGNNVTIRVAEVLKSKNTAYCGSNFLKFLKLQNATVGTEIIQVRAVDNDVGPNAAILYRLKPDAMGNYRTFSVDHESGMVHLKMQLDRERQKIYEVSVA